MLNALLYIMPFDWVEGTGQRANKLERVLSLPHVDQVLGQSHRLRVPRDADRPVQVGRGVPVLAV